MGRSCLKRLCLSIACLYLALFLAAGCGGWRRSQAVVYPARETLREETAGQPGRTGIIPDRMAEPADGGEGKSREEEHPAGEEPGGLTEASGIQEEAAGVFVYVCGCVNRPGVYELPRGSRYAQAVEAAGGFREDADTNVLNLAAQVSDGERYYVPSVSESAVYQEPARAAVPAGEEKISINTGTKEELMRLPGIGEARAEAIIAYREEHGPFQMPEDVMQVPGIKQGAYEKIKNKIGL